MSLTEENHKRDKSKFSMMDNSSSVPHKNIEELKNSWISERSFRGADNTLHEPLNNDDCSP